MRRRARQSAKRSRRTPRGKRRDQSPPRTGACSTAQADARAKQIGDLYAREAGLVRELRQVRADRDRELVSASIEGVPGAVIGHATLAATGRPQTDDELRRVETKLRQATYKARQRHRVAAGNKAAVVSEAKKQKTDAMNDPRRPLYIRETYYDESVLPPDAARPVHPDDDDDDEVELAELGDHDQHDDLEGDDLDEDE